MSEAIKPTKGEAYRFREGSSTVYVSVRIGGGWAQEVAACGPTANGSGEQQANADLIVDAFNVATTTGFTPRQLVERVKELEEALAGMLGFCDEHGDFRNGVTDPTGAIDEGNVTASRYFAAARAALSKSLPNTVAEVK